MPIDVSGHQDRSMKFNRRGTRNGLRLLSIAVAAAMLAAVGAVYMAFSDGIKVRTVLIFEKASGRLNDVDWADFAWMFRPHSGVFLDQLADKRNPFEAVESPYRSPSDIEAGERLFAQHCSSCHGDGGHGGAGGPSLYERVFRAGRSDWALYRTITRGLPGTGMMGRQLPRDDVWRIVSFISRAITARGSQSVGTTAARPPVEPVAAAEIAEAAPGQWLTYSGSYNSQRYSRLKQINRDNVGQLKVEWQRQFVTSIDRVETSPIVRGSMMYVTEPPNRVHALDAASGQLIWTYSHDLPARLLLCCGPENRGVAILGSRIFVGTLDAHLIALDADTGKVLWDVQVADYAKGFSITGAPLVIDDMVVTGVAGAEYGTRGFVDAYDAASGKRRWRFYTIPAPGEPGSETWKGNSSATGGASTWLTGSYDPELRLIYWGVGNPSPNFYGENRLGDNLYTCSVVALDVDTGRLRWYFQFTPHDLHDWDSAQIPLLVDAVIGNSKRKLIAWANRNGFYYLLDRTNGEFLLGTPFVKQNWTDGLGESGRPRIRTEAIPRREGTIVYPSVGGATNWRSPTFDPDYELVYIPAIDRGNIFYASPDHLVDEDGEILAGGYSAVPGELVVPSIKALELRTGRVRWQYVPPPHVGHAEMGGLLSTAGQLVFGGDLETFFALDAETGAELWHFPSGGQVLAAPVAYQLDGRDYITVAAGRSLITFALPESRPQKSASIHPR